MGPSPKSPFKDPVEVQLEGIKILYETKVFFGKFDKYEVKPGKKKSMDGNTISRPEPVSRALASSSS